MKAIHKKCGNELKKSDNMFYYRGRYFPGLICETCNSLYDYPENSFHFFAGIVPNLKDIEFIE